jgi:hypothetical protein
MGLGATDILGTLAALSPAKMTDDQIDALLAGINPATGKDIPGGTPAVILKAAQAEYNKRVKAGTWRQAAPAAPAVKKAGFPIAKIAIFGAVALGGIFLIKKMKGK